ncbi:putative transmembrane protein [Dioscorea sansibarensis]
MGILDAALLVLVMASVATVAGSSSGDGGMVYEKLGIEGGNLTPWAKGLLKFTPVVAPGPRAMAPESRFPLVLAEKRTKRPDILRRFRTYRDGWDITNKHYWASVGFTGAFGFILALVWFVSFGLAFGAHQCCGWQMGVKGKDSFFSRRLCLMFLLVFTCVASTGCILLSVGQDEFHDEVFDTLHFVVNQSDFTIQILRNVTDYLSLAKAIYVDHFSLPSDVQNKIDNLNTDLNDAAETLSEKTTENSIKIKQVFNHVRAALIVVAAVMLVLSILGFALSILGHKHAIYIFVLSGWLLVAVTFILCGIFVILNNAIGDTCTAMNEWADNPQAETALGNILPCVDERTTNQTLYQSKEVINQVVNVVNTAISSAANSNKWPGEPFYYNQSGPLMPYLCSPYDSHLQSQSCGPQEVSFMNASSVWLKYECRVSESGTCIDVGRITPDLYRQLVVAVNVSYALDHYAPLLLSLQDCNFVRETFTSITTQYCPKLEYDLRMVNAGLALISIGVMLCLVLWMFYANRPRREEVFVDRSEVKV